MTAEVRKTTFLIATGAAFACMAVAPEPAKATPTGYSVTAESGARTRGCVKYTSEIVPAKKGRILRFAFTNECGRDVYVMLGFQVGTRVGGWRAPVRLRADETLSGAGKRGNWIMLDSFSGSQRFIVGQGEITTVFKDWPSLFGCHPSARRDRPPCPPMTSIN
jgi:hypothetical protein